MTGDRAAHPARERAAAPADVTDPAGGDLSLSELVGEYEMPADPAPGADDRRHPVERIDGARGEEDQGRATDGPTAPDDGGTTGA